MNFTKMDGQEGVDMRARHCFMKKQILTENPLKLALAMKLYLPDE